MDDSTRASAGLAGNYLDDLIAEALGQTEQAVASGSIPDVLKHYHGLRAAHGDLKAKLTVLFNHLESLSQEVIPTMFANQNIKTISVVGVGRATVADRWSCSMPDKAAAMQWLIDNGDGGMVTQTVHPQTLGAYAKDKAMSGHPLPEELFKVTAAPYVSLPK